MTRVWLKEDTCLAKKTNFSLKKNKIFYHAGFEIFATVLFANHDFWKVYCVYGLVLPGNASSLQNSQDRAV